MKILHVADLHMNQAWFGWIESQAGRFDLIAIAGDLLNAFSNVNMCDQAKVARHWLIGLACPTVICSGNHDFWVDGPAAISDDPWAEAAWVRRLKNRGQIIGMDGDTIEFRGSSPKADAITIAINGWLDVPTIDRDVDMVVTHAPPAGCASATGAEGHDVGDTELWPALQYHPPKFILAGHVHRPGRLACAWPPVEPSTLVLVPGCNETEPIPNHWMIDTDLGRATHCGGESISFRWGS